MVYVKLQNYWQKYTLFFKQIHIKQKKDKKKHNTCTFCTKTQRNSRFFI